MSRYAATLVINKLLITLHRCFAEHLLFRTNNRYRRKSVLRLFVVLYRCVCACVCVCVCVCVHNTLKRMTSTTKVTQASDCAIPIQSSPIHAEARNESRRRFDSHNSEATVWCSLYSPIFLRYYGTRALDSRMYPQHRCLTHIELPHV